ncbi:Ig-like domain-containing protein [Candidatus Poribacteria bacterium]
MRRLVMTCITILLCFTITGLVGCGGDSEDDSENAGSSGVSYMLPGDGASNFPTTSAILITFDRDIAPPSAGNLALTPGVGGTVSYDEDTRTLLFKPSSDLNQHADYSMTVSGITDMEGTAMSPVTVNFSTGLADKDRPKITYSYPGEDEKDVGHGTHIILRFSEPVNRNKLMDGVSFDPKFAATLDGWTFDWSGLSDEEVTLIPPMGLEPFDVNKKYVMEISKGSVLDLSDNSMVTDYKVEFQTLKYPVEKGLNPTISSTVPLPQWLFVVGKRGGTWVIVWGGTQAAGAPAGATPGGTITASSDGRIADDVETHASRRDTSVTQSVSRGNGNRLTFSSQTIDAASSYRMLFSSSSSYLTFSLRPGTPEYINVGNERGHPSSTTFVLSNK